MKILRVISSFVLDSVVIQQTTLFFLVGTLLTTYNILGEAGSADSLLTASLALQLFSNPLMSRERSLNLASRGELDNLEQHLIARALLILFITGVFLYFTQVSVDLVLFSSALCLLTMSSIAILSASQVEQRLYKLRAHCFAIACFVSISFSVEVIFNSSLFLFFAVAALFIMFVVVQLRQSSDAGFKSTRITWVSKEKLSRFGLWIFGILTAEYDRFLIGFKNEALEGVYYGFFNILLMLPLTALLVAAPRLARRTQGANHTMMIVCFSAIYTLVIAFVASFWLSQEVMVLFFSTAVKVAILCGVAISYFKIVLVSPNLAQLIFILSSLVSTFSTIIVALGSLEVAAIVRVFSGLVHLVLVVFFLKKISS